MFGCSHTCSLAINTTYLRALHADRFQEIMTMADVVVKCVKEVAVLTCTCKTCGNKQHVAAVLSRALTSAKELIKLVEHGSRTLASADQVINEMVC